jgi:hypothetical protein
VFWNKGVKCYIGGAVGENVSYKTVDMKNIISKFDPAKQYGNYGWYKKGEYWLARKVLQKQIDEFIPKEYQKRIKWISGYFWPKDMMEYYDVPEGWINIAWKYTPKRRR